MTLQGMKTTQGYTLVVVAVALSHPGAAFPSRAYSLHPNNCRVPSVNDVVAPSISNVGITGGHPRNIEKTDMPRLFRPTRKTATTSTSSSLHKYRRQWEGDDIRWITRLKRRLSSSGAGMSLHWSSVKTYLIIVSAAMYIYEVILTILQLKKNYAAYWPDRAAEMVIDSVWGTGVPGPLATAFGFSAAAFQMQPLAYRVLTSGFVHSSLLHLIINMATLQRQPSWLETGLGWPLYMSTFLWSIVAGNMMHVLQCPSRWDRTLCLGASSGLCGLYGLMYVCLTRMGSGRGGQNLVRGMAVLVLSGLWLDNVSSAANVGGFLCGIATGLLCGPRFVKDYSMRRKNSVEFDPASKDYRQAMGFGISPTRGGPIPLVLIWTILLAWAIINPATRSMPLLIWRKLINPA